MTGDVPALVATENETAREVLFDGASPFQRVFVVEEGGQRVLRFDDVAGNDQSALDPANPDRVVFEYVRLAGLALRLVEQPRRALVIGLGGGAFPRLLLQQSPKIAVDAVEIDPVVVDVARRFFHVPRTPRLHIVTADGVLFLHDAAAPRTGTAKTEPWDIVLLDAFSGNGIPPALSSKSFFDDARAVLAERGVAVLNIALMLPADVELITGRFAEAFPGCVVVTGKNEDNRVLFGGRVPVDPEALRVAALTSVAHLPYDAHLDVESIKRCPAVPKEPPAKTPTKAPVKTPAGRMSPAR